MACKHVLRDNCHIHSSMAPSFRESNLEIFENICLEQSFSEEGTKTFLPWDCKTEGRYSFTFSSVAQFPREDEDDDYDEEDEEEDENDNYDDDDFDDEDEEDSGIEEELSVSNSFVCI
jgi:hypothetical protein